MRRQVRVDADQDGRQSDEGVQRRHELWHARHFNPTRNHRTEHGTERQHRHEHDRETHLG